MKLIHLRARNFKGLTFDLQLADLTFLIGANFRGKTARMDAIRFLLLGYLPELGKRPADAFALASGREMEVVGDFDTGLQMSHHLALKGNSVKATNAITGPGSEDFEEKMGQVDVMMDSSVYFSLTDRKRVEYVAAHCPPTDGITMESALLRLKAIGDNALTTLKLPDALENQTVQQWVDDAILIGAEALTGIKRHADTMQETIRGMEHLRLADGQTADVGPQIAALQAEIATATEERGRISQRVAEYQRTAFRRTALQQQVAGILPARVKLENLSQLLTARRKEIADLPAPVNPQEMARLNHAITTAAVDTDRARTEWTRLSNELTVTKRELAELGSKTTCPFCGATGIGWQSLKKTQLTELIDALTLQRDAQVEAGKLAKLRLGELQLELAGHNATATKRASAEADERDLARQHTALEGTIGLAESQKAELENMGAPDQQPQVDLEMADTCLRVKRAKLAELDSARQKAEQRKAELQRLAQAEKNRDQAKAEAAVGKAALEELRKIQAELVAQAFGPLLKTANEFFGAILRTPIAYKDGEIGTWRDGIWVGHHTFSGTEKALCYAAIQAALSATSPFRVMLLDELGRLDDTNAAAVTACLHEAVNRGMIDTVVGIDAGRAGIYRLLAKASDSTCRVEEIT